MPPAGAWWTWCPPAATPPAWERRIPLRVRPIALLAAATLLTASLPQSLPTFSRDVAPFAVLDSAGTPMAMPFLGGFDAPRPQLVDIDGDGDADLFVQEQSDRIMFFEHVVESGRHRFVFRESRWLGLSVGEWYRFADMDRDGDFDLLAEAPFSWIRYYRNDGTRTVPRFVLAADSVRDVDGRPIYADRQNIAQAADIDCNGRIDLMLGRQTGTITRYELAEFTAAGAPRFRLLTDRFEDIEIIATNSRPSLHGANTMAFVDLDRDNDLDLLWGDFFEAGLLYIENTGSCSQPSLRSTPAPFPPQDPIRTSGYNAPALGDTDGDGDLDLLVGVLGGAYNALASAVGNLLHLEQRPAGWTVTTRRFLTSIDVGSESLPALADIDGDGDLDLAVGNRVDVTNELTASVRWFRNTGTARAPAFRDAGTLLAAPGFHSAPAFGDLDGDGRPEVLLGSFGATVSLYRATGAHTEPRFALADSALIRLTRGANTAPALADVDGDGDLDLVVGEASGALNYYRNAGTRTAPRFELVADEWLGIDAGRRSAPAFVDLDGDGDLDLVVGAEDGPLHAFRNMGPSAHPQFVPSSALAVDSVGLASPAFGDLNGDGLVDLLLGSSSGGVRYYGGRR